MSWKRAVAAVAMCVGTFALAASTAGAHSVNVQPPGGGQATCQFLGGPGNPGHAGHANGHSVALGAEQSGAISIGGC